MLIAIIKPLKHNNETTFIKIHVNNYTCYGTLSSRVLFYKWG